MYGWILRFVIKPYLPYIMDYGMKLFKWDKTLDYVEKPNELDVQVRDIEKKCTDIAFNVTAMKDVLKGLGEDQHPPAIDLDEWEQIKADMKKIKNKKAFKKLGK